MKINKTILEIIAVSGDLPCSLINRFEYSQRNMYRIIGRLMDAGLIKRYRKDKITSLRLTKKGEVYLQSSNTERFGEFEKSADKSDKEKRLRLHRIASTYVAMRNAGIKFFNDEKPNVFTADEEHEYVITEPVFYSSLDIKQCGLECVKVGYCRAVGVVLTSDDTGFVVYHSRNALMKWSSKSEQKWWPVLTGILLRSRIQIDNFDGLMIGQDMEFAKRVLFSDGGLTNNLFKIDETFNNFYYVPEDKNGDKMIAFLIDKEKRKNFRRKIMSEFEIEPELFPYACDGVNLNGQPVLLAYTFNLEELKKFKSGIEYFETKGVVICFEFQRAVLEDYFGELVDIVVIDMEI